MSFEMKPILNNILFTVNCNRLSSLDRGPLLQCHIIKLTGKHFDCINKNKTSSGALRPIFPKMLLKAW